MLFVPALHRTRELSGLRRTTEGTYRSNAIEGALVRVRPGVFALATEWRRAHPEGRTVALVRALCMTSHPSPVISHESAAALHGLPLFRPETTRVHITLADARPGAAVGTIRHRGRLEVDETVIQDGIRITSLPRTVADICRTASFERAVVVADAALGRMTGDGAHGYDKRRASRFCQLVNGIVDHSAHGTARARRVLVFADGRAQLPGESISRIRLTQLGFHDIRLQKRVPAPYGRDYFVDFACSADPGEWLGEFDGRVKYAESGMRAGRDVAQVLDEEKQREDWIRGSTGLPLVRWGWDDIRTPEALAQRLTAFGIRPPR